MELRREKKAGLIQILNTYSVPVSLGLSITYCYFSHWLFGQYNIYTAIMLGVGVWIVYTLDHLLDGMRLKEKAKAPRHYLHYIHRKGILIILAPVAILFVLASYRYLYRPSLIFGVFLGLLTGLHLFINFLTDHRKGVFLKEPMIALVVSLALTGLPYAENGGEPGVLVLPFMVIYFINLSNLLLFSFFDHDEDMESGNVSLSVRKGKRGIMLFIGISLLLAIGSLVAMSFSRSQELKYLLVLAIMIFMLSFILSNPGFFAKNERYRFWGDMIYVLPVVAIII